MKWLKDRIKEKTTWLGLSGIFASLGVLVDFNEAPAIANTLAKVGADVVAGNPAAAVATLIVGLWGAFSKG